jgi:hypothetical protein
MTSIAKSLYSVHFSTHKKALLLVTTTEEYNRHGKLTPPVFNFCGNSIFAFYCKKISAALVCVKNKIQKNKII